MSRTGGRAWRIATAMRWRGYRNEVPRASTVRGASIDGDRRLCSHAIRMPDSI
jgi:hypothetical protein